MQTPEKKAPEACRPYDDDHCAGCDYEGMVGCVAMRIADTQAYMAQLVKEETCYLNTDRAQFARQLES